MDIDVRKRMPLFPIGIVQKLTDLSARQIRYYEQHELVAPVRSDGNQRLFSFLEVECLLRIRALLDEGLNMAGVKQRLERVARERLAQTSRQEPTDVQVHQRMHNELLESRFQGSTSEFQGDLFRFYRRR